MAMMTSKCSLLVLSEVLAVVALLPLLPQLPYKVVPARLWQLQLPLQQLLQQPLQEELPPTPALSLF